MVKQVSRRKGRCVHKSQHVDGSERWTLTRRVTRDGHRSAVPNCGSKLTGRHGARALVGTSFRHGVKPRLWMQALIGRRPVNVASVAVAHKTARALWAMIRREEAYRPPATFMAAA